MHLGGVYSDIGVSGGAPLDKRPSLLAAIEALQAGGVLLVSKRDRLARDVMVSAMVERLVDRKGASVRSCTGTGDADGPEGLLMRRLVDAFAEYERELIRARTRSALAVKKSKNERVGGIPYGARLSTDRVHLERDPQEQRALLRIRKLRSEGVSIRKVAARLNQEGVPARGHKWHPTTVARVLSRHEGNLN